MTLEDEVNAKLDEVAEAITNLRKPRRSGIGSEGIPGTEYPERTIYTDDNLYYVPFVAEDGRVGYRIGVAVRADEPGGDWASREAFVYLNPSSSIDAPMPEMGDVFVYSGTHNDPAEDKPEVFIGIGPDTFGLSPVHRRHSTTEVKPDYTPADWKHTDWCPSPTGHPGDCWAANNKARGIEPGPAITIEEVNP